MATSVYDCSEGDPITTVADTGTLGRSGSATDVSAVTAIAPSGTGAFSFNGTSSIITIAAGFDDLIDDLDVTFWMQCSDNVSYQPLIEAGACGGWALYLSGGVVRFGNRCADETAGATDVCDGSTHKIRVTCVAGAVTIYVDDVSDGTGTTNDAWASGAGYNIGGNGSAFFAGTLDNITISGTQAAGSGPVVSLTASTTSIAENGGTATILALLSATASATVTVAVGFAGSASTGSDYTLSTTSIAIASGQTSGSLTATAINDSVYEGNEAFTASITSVTGGGASASSTASTSTVTIVDDESQPSVTISASPTSIAENGGVSVVTATLSNASVENVTVNFAFTGTATNATDYTRSATSVTINAGSTSGSISITAIDDATYDGNETVVVDVSSVTNGTENGTQSVTVTIIDDEAQPTVNLSASATTLAENGGVVYLAALLSHASYQNIDCGISFGGQATVSSDYSRTAIIITVPAGSTSGSISITALQDLLDEDNETITVQFGSIINGTAGATSSLSFTITDDDATPTITITRSADTLAENGGSVAFTAMLSAVSGRDVVFDILPGGTESTFATFGTDYTLSSHSLTVNPYPRVILTPGQTSASIAATAIADTVFEPDEVVYVYLLPVSGCALGVPFQATASIVNEYLAPFVSLSASAASLAESGSSTAIVATLDHTHSQNVTIVFGLGGTANSASDYSISTNSIVIASGATSGSISIAALQDSISESPETVIVSLASVTNGTAASAASTATVTIIDDDTSGAGATGLSGLSGLSGIH